MSDSGFTVLLPAYRVPRDSFRGLDFTRVNARGLNRRSLHAN
jgi:hypothetical protein